jgi:DNA primase
MRIPENKIEEIRLATNIVDVISEVVQLRKRGRNYIGLCPFHNEKTPSFTVSEDKQIFHCFGCHTGGNAFKFLMDYGKISFIESVQELAEKAGIHLDYEEDTSKPEEQSEQEILYDINHTAGRYFSDNLLNPGEGDYARSYFENRKIKIKTMREFGLGYALPERNSFVEFARSKNIDLEKALHLGLIGRYNDGRLYDKFAGRIIFPIFSPNGRVVAFAGRILEKKEGTAKYLNSPESQIYFKSRVLYGLSHAKDEIRRLDKAIIVEGYMDLISLYQAGVKNVVAVSGTALTDEQVQLLSRYTKNVVLLFDADTAGIKASMRSIEILLRKDMEIKVASLPGGEDPDSFVNSYGKEKFEDVIKQAQNFLEYQTAFYEKQGMFEDASKTAEAIRELVKPIAIINDELKRTLLIKSISKKFNLREMLMESELEKALAKNAKLSAPHNQNKGKSDLVIPEPEPEPKEEALPEEEEEEKESAKFLTTEEYSVERDIIKLLFEGEKKIQEEIFRQIHPDDFLFEAHKKIVTDVYTSYMEEENVEPDYLISKQQDPLLQNYLRELVIDSYYISKRWDTIESKEAILEKLLSDAITLFLMRKLKREIDNNHSYLQDARDPVEEIEILTNIKELTAEMHGLIGGSNRNFIDLTIRKN